MTNPIDAIKSALLMFKARCKPYRRYTGEPVQIAKKIIDICYNGKFFQVSDGHFQSFYSRDFGMCVKSLLQLGYHKKCESTLKYALYHYKKQNKVTTTIDHTQKCVDFFAPGPDSLAFLLYSIRLTNPKLAQDKRYKTFLESQIRLAKKRFWDEKQNRITKGYHTTAKDHYRRNGSCYDVCMMGMIAKEARTLKLQAPNFPNFKQILIDTYWDKQSGGFFDDLTKQTHSADAQIFPFYCGLLGFKSKLDKQYFKKAQAQITRQRLDRPFPIKYTTFRNKSKELFWPSLFAPNYQGTAVWIHIGMCYMEVLANFDIKRTRFHVNQYHRLIKEHRNFLEVYDKKGKPYKTLFYKSDESMLWVSVYLALRRRVSSP